MWLSAMSTELTYYRDLWSGQTVFLEQKKPLIRFSVLSV